MGMLVNDVTALVASLAKVCQPQLRGGWGLGQLGGSGPATGTAAEHATSAAPPQSHSGSAVFFQGESFVHLSIHSFIQQAFEFLICVRYYSRGWRENLKGHKITWALE